MRLIPRAKIGLRSGVLLLLMFLRGCVTSRPSANSFTFDGSAISPSLIQSLVGDLAEEQSSIAAIDLEGSRRDNKAVQERQANEGIVLEPNGSGYVAFRYLGTTPSGLHVLIVMANGGGSGVFEDVLWVRLVRDVVSENGQKRNRTMLLKVGSFTLGDRDDGDVRLNGTRLFIGKSKYRPRETIISLE